MASFPHLPHHWKVTSGQTSPGQSLTGSGLEVTLADREVYCGLETEPGRKLPHVVSLLPVLEEEAG